MSGDPSPERIVAVGLTVLIALQPIVGVSGATGTAAVTSTVAPELGQAATPTPTPSPLPPTAPGTTGRSPGAEGPDPVLVLSGLIAVVFLALGVWFLLR